jgi:hypothetical protein
MSDFGLAKIFSSNDTEGNTKRIAGTYSSYKLVCHNYTTSFVSLIKGCVHQPMQRPEQSHFEKKSRNQFFFACTTEYSTFAPIFLGIKYHFRVPCEKINFDAKI